MLIGPYITPLCRICLRIIGKTWGIMGGISGKFLKGFLEVFEEVLAHAYLERVQNYVKMKGFIMKYLRQKFAVSL